MAVFHKRQYMDKDDYLTISGNFAVTSERLSATALLYYRR